MRKHISLILSIALTFSLFLNAVQFYTLGVFTPKVRAQFNLIDMCTQTGGIRSSIAVNIGAAGTSQIIALSSGKSVFICGFGFTVAGLLTTAATVKFVYGTGSNCGTGTNDMTGPMAGSAVVGQALWIPSTGAGTQLSTPVSQAVCLTVTGVSPGIAGYVTYVQS